MSSQLLPVTVYLNLFASTVLRLLWFSVSPSSFEIPIVFHVANFCECGNSNGPIRCGFIGPHECVTFPTRRIRNSIAAEIVNVYLNKSFHHVVVGRIRRC